MSLTKKSLSVLELKRLLIEILEQRPDICLRYRAVGEMWHTNFTRIVFVTDNGGFFRDETTNRLLHITNLDKIMQFELDHSFQHYQAHFHFDVVIDHQ